MEFACFNPKVLIFFLFYHKRYVVGTHQKRLAKAFPVSTHNISFHGEIRQIFTGYPPLSRPMEVVEHMSCI